jgi:hypothetical protein
MHIANLTTEIDDYEYRSKTCCYDRCADNPILSHAIARNFISKLNTDKRKVLMLQPKITPIHNKLNPKLIRAIDIEKFACFFGFCAKHDDELFKQIDVFDGKMTKQKAVLVHYRNICYGMNHIKTQILCEQHMSRQCLVQGEPLDKSANKLIRMLKKGYFSRRLDYCLEQHRVRKKQLESMIILDRFDDIEYEEFRGGLDNPVFFGRSSYLLHQRKKFFSRPGYNYMPWISYTTLLTGSENHLVFCWLRSDEKHVGLFKKKNISQEIIAALAWACSDDFAVEESLYKKHAAAIDMVIKKCRVY